MACRSNSIWTSLKNPVKPNLSTNLLMTSGLSKPSISSTAIPNSLAKFLSSEVLNLPNVIRKDFSVDSIKSFNPP